MNKIGEDLKLEIKAIKKHRHRILEMKNLEKQTRTTDTRERRETLRH